MRHIFAVSNAIQDMLRAKSMQKTTKPYYGNETKPENSTSSPGLLPQNLSLLVQIAPSMQGCCLTDLLTV
jgi:hypothetical protein